MRPGRTDPGDCIVCGAAHCSCGGPGREVVQLPNRDAARASSDPLLGTLAAPAGEVNAGDPAPRQSTLPPGSFSTATYRGTKPRRR